MTAKAFAHRLSKTRGFPSSTLVTATTEELIAGGKTSLLQSNELREELAAFIEWYADHERHYDCVSSSIIDAYDRQFGFLELEWSDLIDSPKRSAEIEELVDDSDAISTKRQLTNAYWICWRGL